MGEIVLGLCGLIGGVLGAWVGVQVGLARLDERLKSIDKRLDDHIKDSNVHFHRRESDLTGQWPQYKD